MRKFEENTEISHTRELLDQCELMQLRGRHLDAIHSYFQALKESPDNAEIWRACGKCFLEMKDASMATVALQRAMSLDPADSQNERLLMLAQKYLAARSSVPTQQSNSPGLNFEGEIAGVGLLRVTPGAKIRHSDQNAKWELSKHEGILSEEIWYSSFTLMTLLLSYGFGTVLDIGSHKGSIARIFDAFGKKVTTVEVADGFDADYKGDFLDAKFASGFDCIWCSQTLEHQRNIGHFLDKCYEDLNSGGILALTVPYQSANAGLCMGHCNYFSPWSLAYQVAAAGFDVRNGAIAVYLDNVGIIVRKSALPIKKTSFAPYPAKELSNQELSEFALEHLMTQEQAKALWSSSTTENLSELLPDLDQSLNWYRWPLNVEGSKDPSSSCNSSPSVQTLIKSEASVGATTPT